MFLLATCRPCCPALLLWLAPMRLLPAINSVLPARLPCLQVAWGRHETIGEYMTAALVWLENRGQVDIGDIARRFHVPRLTDLQVNAATLATPR